MNNNQSFYAIIPSTVLLDLSLNDGCKLFYALISTLLEKEGYCFASNEWLSKKSGRSERTIQRWVKQLEKGGHISVEIYNHNQNRKIYVSTTPRSSNTTPDNNGTDDTGVAPPRQKCHTTSDNGVAHTPDKNVTQVNKEVSNQSLSNQSLNSNDDVEQQNCSTLSDDSKKINDLSKNDKSEAVKSGLQKKIKSESSPAPEIQHKKENLPHYSDTNIESQAPEKENLDPPEKPDPPPRKVLYMDAVDEIIAYLNDATGRKFDPAADTSKFIRARLMDGHKIQVLKDVIDLKASEWTGDDTMEKYLRPQTLFNKTKFTAYIEELTYIRKKNKMLERLKITVDNFVKSAGLVLIWSHNEEKALYDLAHKINKSNKQRGDPTTASQINESLDILLKKLPDFWFEKFSITKLDKNFNSIINEIRKSNGGKDAEWAAYVASFDQPQAGTD